VSANIAFIPRIKLSSFLGTGPCFFSQKDEMDFLMTSAAALLVLLNHVTKLIHGTCRSSKSDVILKNYVIVSLPSADLNDCWLKCQNEDRCQSLNYFLELQLCEINNNTIQRAPKSIIAGVPFTTYFENPFWGEYPQTRLNNRKTAIKYPFTFKRRTFTNFNM